MKPSQALHVVLRVVPAVGSLRRRKLYQALRYATIIAAVRERIRIVHISLQRTHVHLLVEAADAGAFARGLQGFEISAARHVNMALGDGGGRRRRGPVFADRSSTCCPTGVTMERPGWTGEYLAGGPVFEAVFPFLTGKNWRTRH